MVQLQIAHIGSRGDGVAHTPEGIVYVPYALPDETVNVEINGERGRLIEVITPSPHRINAMCPLFMQCGGCVAQHMSVPLYQEWKREHVIKELSRAGLDVSKLMIAPLTPAHGEGRRRVVWHVREVEGQRVAGLMQARSHTLIAVDHCPILHPDLQNSAALAKGLARCLKNLRKPLDVHITATQTGLDIDLRGYGNASESERIKIIAFANTHDVARIGVHGEMIIERRAPTIGMGNVEVALPAGSFLQATHEGEEYLGRQMVEALKGAKNIADLFSGCGPFALRLAHSSRVHAVENHAPALKALEKAVRTTSGLKPITTEIRDLFRRPLLPSELKAYDAVVLDPPRSGALAQVTEIARAPVPRVMMISCDASTFARDVAVLVAAGYTMGAVHLIDQFVYSPHVELACVLSYAKTRVK
jgi:23S rRNA (uracil1939-C5)-methyltransferase